MLSLNPKELSPVQLQGYLQGAVGPRPIAFASTVNAEGQANLSPFSFFNMFSSNPPILIFSPARRVRDTTVKHTLTNVQATKEVVINIANYAMVQQVSLSSTEYGDGVDEFVKAGFTKLASEVVAPFRVAESPVQLECVVNDVVALGDGGGAGNLVICEVVRLHIHPEILNEQGGIDQHKIDLIARMGGNWYTRASAGMFEVEKPLSTLGIGVDALPESVRHSPYFDGNDLGKLGNVEALPTAEEQHAFLVQHPEAAVWMKDKDREKVHLTAKKYLEENDALSAWKLLLSLHQ